MGRRASWVPQYEGIEGAIRMRNYSPKTLATYRLWMRKFQSFVRSKPADELDGEDAKAFLTDLAVRQGVAASTQNQAFNALLVSKQVENYRNRISGPLLDRIDIHFEAPAVEYKELSSEERAESSAAIRERVLRARKISKNASPGNRNVGPMPKCRTVS